VELATILAAAFVILIIAVIAVASIKIVNQYERVLVFTLGRTSPTEVKGPGWVFIVPIAQRAVKVDLRERFIEVPSQTSITKDNAPISIDFLIYWRIVDPYRSVVEVQNFEGALQNIATTTLRAVVGDILLDDVLSKRDQINEVLRIKLDEVTHGDSAFVAVLMLALGAGKGNVGLANPTAPVRRVLRDWGAEFLLETSPA